MRLIGIEPTHAAPEATALSTELQMHVIDTLIILQQNSKMCKHNLKKTKIQTFKKYVFLNFLIFFCDISPLLKV